MSLLRMLLAAALFFFIWEVKAQDLNKNFKLRIEELEKQVEELMIQKSQEHPQTNSFFNDKLTLGGFFEPSYTVIAGPDTELQAGSRTHLLGLNLSASFNDKLRFVTQLISGLSAPLTNEHNDPRAPTVSPNLEEQREYSSFVFGSIVAQGYVEYIYNSQLRMQAGLGYVPFGHYAKLREPVLFERRGGPQTIRTDNLFSPLWMGINLVGTISEHFVGYNLYTTPSVDQSQKQGGGARFWKSSADNRFTFGLSTQFGKNKTDNYKVVGADLAFLDQSIKIIAEFATQMTEGENPWAISLSPTYYFHKEFLIFVFGDYAFASQNETKGSLMDLPDPYQKWEYGGGINWLPTTYTRYRAGITFHDYVGSQSSPLGNNRDYTSLDLSVGVAF